MTSTSINIRPYRPTDQHDVVALWAEVFPHDPPWNEPHLVIRRKLTTQRELFLVAVRQSRIVGTVLAGFDGCRGWVHHLGVSRALRRAGIGTALVREAAARLELLGAPKVNLQVRAGNDAAVGFYQSLGFEVEERVSMSLLLDWERSGKR